MRGHQTSHRISSTRAGGYEDASWFASSAGVAVSHVHSALLVADQDELHVGLDCLQCIEDRERGTAGIAEDILDAEFVECFDERLCAVELFFTHNREKLRFGGYDSLF